ncbi:DUF4167 domain-containing protein [uncultured Phenylobacterium sp.]|uniref:DUF4167 domain-containing protein n=1 Tax=uncultured Phenylobacterium sp. TaxID=349273 RepID=UPI0025D441C1|nr:DUF4167 domain-containing protein [uncultured Phenylobacterium sp.]
MRDFKGMKRQRGRNRGGGGSGGGGGKPTQNANRAFDSNGPDGVKVRGNAQHVFEKYQQLARDANAAGDRVLGENYLQHAEHYFRLLRAIQPNRPASEILGRDQFASGYDIDFEDESGQPQGEPYDPNAIENGGDGRPSGGEDRGQWQARDERPRDDRSRDDRPRDERPRDDRPRDERPRDDRPRDDRPRDDRPRDDRPRNNNDGARDRGPWRDRDGRDARNRNRDDRPRDDRPRDERPRDDRPRDDRPPRDERPRAEGDEPRRERPERQDRPERDPLPVVQPQGDPPERGPMLRDSDGGASHAPAFLQARTAPAPATDEAAEKPKPRRRRAPRTFEAGEGPAPTETEEA